MWNFPGSTVGGSLPVGAGDTGLIPGLGGLHMLGSSQARASQLLTLHSRIWEPQILSLCAPTTDPHTPEPHSTITEPTSRNY